MGNFQVCIRAPLIDSMNIDSFCTNLGSAHHTVVIVTALYLSKKNPQTV